MMTEIKNLYEQLEIELGKRNLEAFEIPKFIEDNLRHRFYDWQSKAIKYFLAYNDSKNGFLKSPTHLMFNLATGAGKTLLMAATLLYYYKQGYRYFIFLVNRNNIVDKTENNFIDSTHPKYLFTEKIVIDDQTVSIKKVDVFSDHPQGIEIKFTSIQKLYNDIHIEKENQTTLNDLNQKKIVMFADEAHHLNADTKSQNGIQQEIWNSEITNRTGAVEVERKGWEHTVIELILNKSGHQKENRNILLEFTATVPTTQSVTKKYENKIIYQFALKEFLQAGYTKEINLISSTFEKKERVFQAILFQWYRHRIALKYQISNFKPVILFRSKTIDQSKADYQAFLTWIEGILSSDFDFLQTLSQKISKNNQLTIFEMGKSRTEQILTFIHDENIPLGEIVNWMEQNYQERNIIITNSKINKSKSEKTDQETEQLLNNLEDKNNHIRAIFTVDRLTEGWDVLNLFDIVRLYEGKDQKGNRKAGSATIAEKQLIGRGVRYFPFDYDGKIKNKRKFDQNLTHELRVLEELYFHSTSDPCYISELKRELKKDGYLKNDQVVETFSLKKEFKESDFYKNTKIWYNRQINNPNRKRKTLDNLEKDFLVPYQVKGLELVEEKIDLENQQDIQKLSLQEGKKTITKKFKEIEKHIFLKAINIKAKKENSLFQFEKLKEELEIESIDELQTNQLADFELKMVVSKGTRYDDLANADKLGLVLRFLETVFEELENKINPKIGSNFILGSFEKFFGEPKTKSIDENNLNKKIPRDNDWYVLDSFDGTSEEEKLIEFIDETIGNLKNQYQEVYLLRNEEVYKIYDFETGRGFQPDFILFLKTREKQKVFNNLKTELYYQIFIEPKGDQFIGDDDTFKSGKEGWKERFLEEISKRYGLGKVIIKENPHYRLVGLPFFNKDHNKNFEKEYGNLYVKQS